MKRYRLFHIICMLITAFIYDSASAQANITSSNGYTVHITLEPVSIIPSTTNCPFGYNYNVSLHYTVTFSGTNIPANLYTLQGNLSCGSATHFYSLPTNGGTGTVTTVSNVWNPASTCNTATPGSLLCNNTIVNIEGPGIAVQAITVPLASGGPLPIELTDFNAEAQKGKVKLTWNTLSEINNDYFTIERSVDGSNWAAIATLKGSTHSSALVQYQFTDESPLFSDKLYYRVKQTDLNGISSYSSTKMVRYTAGDNIYAYPVPNTGQSVHFNGIIRPKDLTLVLRQADGAIIFTSTLAGNSITLPHIQAGMYTISLYNKTAGSVTHLRYVQL